MPDVTIGDRSHPVQPFNAYKALEAGDLVGKITEQVPELAADLAAFAQKYRTDHAASLDRAAAEFRFPGEAAGISEAAWEAVGHRLTFPPDDPPREVRWASVFRKAFTGARGPVVDLLALAITPNSELERADTEGSGAATALVPYRAEILHRASLPQLVKLAAIVGEVLRVEFAEVADDAKKLAGLLGWTPSQQPEQTGSGQKKRARRSSNGSASGSAGTAEKSSTEPRGASSARSAGG